MTEDEKLNQLAQAAKTALEELIAYLEQDDPPPPGEEDINSLLRQALGALLFV